LITALALFLVLAVIQRIRQCRQSPQELLLGATSSPHYDASCKISNHLDVIGFGLLVGMLVHITVDTLIWFSPIDFVWPFSLFHGVYEINLWAGVRVPTRVNGLLSMAEHLFVGLFLTALRFTIRHACPPQQNRLSFVVSSNSPSISHVDPIDHAQVDAAPSSSSASSSVSASSHPYSDLESQLLGGKPKLQNSVSIFHLAVEICEYIYAAVILVSLFLLDSAGIFLMVFIPLLFVSFPAILYFTYSTRRFLVWKGWTQQ
jgi:hypothetical protein